MVFQHALASFSQHAQRDAKTFIGFLRSRHRLKQQVQRRAALHCLELSRDVGQAASLRGNIVSVDQPLQRVENRAHALHCFGRGIHADDGIATAIKQAVKCGEQNSRYIVCRMVGLQANAQDAALAHGVAAMGDHANLVRGQHQVFVAHELGYSGGNFRRDGPVQCFQRGFIGFVTQDEFAKLADRHAADG